MFTNYSLSLKIINMALERKNGSNGGAHTRFLKEPKAFNGENEEQAAVWLSRMNRLKKSAKINDEEMLLIVEENLVMRAESWWHVVGSRAENWEQFEEAFKKQYLSDLEDKWWSAIYELRQGDEFRSVDEVAIRMEELFNLLGNKDQGLHVRTFLKAIKPKIAYEVEKENKPNTFAIAKERARQIERSQLKYGLSNARQDEVTPENNNRRSQAGAMEEFQDNKSEASAMSSVMSLVEKLEKLSINLVALQEAVSTAPPIQSNGNGYNYGARRPGGSNQGGIVCFGCGEPGHKKYECKNEEFMGNKHAKPPLSGSNSLPLGDKSSGKANEHQQ